MTLYVLCVSKSLAEKPATFYFDVEAEYTHAIAVAKEHFDVVTHHTDYISDASEFERWVQEQG